MDQDDSKTNSIDSTRVWECSSDIKLSLSPMTHKRSTSSTTEVSPITKPNISKPLYPSLTGPINQSKLYRTLIPASIHSRSPSDFSLTEFERKPKSLVTKLNEEILILSSQLKQANEIIAYLNNKLNETFDSYDNLKETEESLQKKNRELNLKVFALQNCVNDLKEHQEYETEVIKNRLEEEFRVKIQEVEERERIAADENKKLIGRIESRFVEVIMNLNNKYIEERILNKNIEKSAMRESDEEGSTLFSPCMNRIPKDEFLRASPVMKICGRKEEADEIDIDNSLRLMFGQISAVEYEKAQGRKERVNSWNEAEGSQFKVPAKILNATRICDFVNKKLLSVLWYSWRSIEGENNPAVIRKNQLIKSSIELWIKSSQYEDKLIECFYSWRSQVSLSKLSKLKDFKSVFN